MKLYTVGIDHLTINMLRQHEFEPISEHTMPDPRYVEDHILLFTSDVVDVDQLESIREQYDNCVLIYKYNEPGIRKLTQIHAHCASLGIHFVSRRATAQTIMDLVRSIMKEETDEEKPIIGFISSSVGVGCTRVASTYASRMAGQGKKVIMLGLDLYDPGYDNKPHVSLDQWRPRLTGRVLQPADFEQLPKHLGFSYLPGNFDFLAIQDYQEEEIEYLIDQAAAVADVVICDFGSIPESAAWYAGIQKSSLRYFVSHPKDEYRVESILKVLDHMQLYPTDFFLAVNRSDIESANLTISQFARVTGMPMKLEIPYYSGHMEPILPLGKKEIAHLDEHIRHVFQAFGWEAQQKKKGVFV